MSYLEGDYWFLVSGVVVFGCVWVYFVVFDKTDWRDWRTVEREKRK